MNSPTRHMGWYSRRSDVNARLLWLIIRELTYDVKQTFSHREMMLLSINTLRSVSPLYMKILSPSTMLSPEEHSLMHTRRLSITSRLEREDPIMISLCAPPYINCCALIVFSCDEYCVLDTGYIYTTRA